MNLPNLTGMTRVNVEICLHDNNSSILVLPFRVASITCTQNSEWHLVGVNLYTLKSIPKFIPDRTINLLKRNKSKSVRLRYPQQTRSDLFTLVL